MATSTALQIFITLLGAYIAKYFPQVIDPSLKPMDSANCIECRSVKYDFIIVGAGSAGSVLAHRLSENPKWNILLIEAGDDENYITSTPSLQSETHNTRVDWNYTTVRQERACLNLDGFCAYPRGHVMGGSSTINGMLYVRGNPADYDEWEQMGNPGWGSKDVFKYFLRLENMTIPELSKSPLHSTRGPLTVSYSRYYASVLKDVFQAGIDSGLKSIDYNGDTFVGISYAQTTTDGVTRASASKCYLDPIRNRSNLRVFKNTLVTKVLIDKNKRTAIGVRCLTFGKQYDVMAKNEVILSAGSINTPQILMLSGIGPKEHLEEKGIPVIADLPVGKNLQDHAMVVLNFKQENFTEECNKQFGDEVAYNYAKNRQGELTSNTLSILAYPNNTQSSDLPPNLQFTFAAENFVFKAIPGACLEILVVDVNPKSRGTVKLNSTSIFDAPLIDPNFYGVEEDMLVTISGVQQAFNYLKAPILSKYVFSNIANESCVGILNETDYIKCIIKYQTATIYHPCGTTRMGSILDKSTVVNSELKVHHIKRLRIVDAGIMPRITRGNTNAPTIMLAEKASDIIKSAYIAKL
ncbi:hypothetical protein O3M35_012408 [Rhynocoris fuscipes]|uniref:Glucose-methanol-choline oxidoreductase N-terminal domain-containing protein n=1 Tax=Rhynocoris fuscipes TaxID=488301 RepID=A0AAW1CVS2_9HEMI